MDFDFPALPKSLTAGFDAGRIPCFVLPLELGTWNIEETMAKKTTTKAKQVATETGAKQFGHTTAAVPLQTLTPLSASKPSQAPAQQVQKASAKAVAPQVPLVPAMQSPQPPAQSQPPKSSGKALFAEATTPSAVPRVKVTFLLPICDAKRVFLSGEFNGWSRDATPMRRHDDGRWEATVDLAPGRYEYKFVRDGEWIPDLLASENVWNLHGTLNSVVEVRA
jgi:Glycogen recognition site of AMP-activated protein kinase